MIKSFCILLTCLFGCTQTDRSFSELADSGIPTSLPMPSRLVAIGDVHGDFSAAKRALLLAGVIDDSGTWIGGNTVVIQLGDQLDRGDDERKIIDSFKKIETGAKASGGGFYWLIGNHEVMNVQLDFRYVTPKGFQDFDEFRALANGDDLLSGLTAAQKGRGAAFRPGGPYARHLAANNVVMKIGDSIFVHGGIQKKYAVYGIDKINKEMRSWLSGDVTNPPDFIDDDFGPIWDRTFGENFGTAGCAQLKRILQLLDAQRLVVAHTIQANGITSRCGGRAWRIDTGMSGYYAGPVQALEILPGVQPKILK